MPSRTKTSAGASRAATVNTSNGPRTGARLRGRGWVSQALTLAAHTKETPAAVMYRERGASAIQSASIETMGGRAKSANQPAPSQNGPRFHRRPLHASRARVGRATSHRPRAGSSLERAANHCAKGAVG